MGLKLHTVPAARGLRWVRQGFAECFRHPMGYAGLFVLFMLAALVFSALPAVGGLLLMMIVPLLSLAFMMAVAGAQRGEPVRPGVYLALWRDGGAAQRRTLINLCLAYALATLAILALCNLIDGGRFDDLVDAMAGGKAGSAEIEQLAAAPGVLAGAIARVVLSVLLSLPFWHAPALVRWGRQGLLQALFTSLLAVWRTRGAFAVYGLTWAASLVFAGAITALALTLLGLGSVAPLVMMPMALIFTTAFYASLYFCFVDTFGAVDD